MVLNPCLLEPFRNQPSKTEIRNCILKLFSLYSELQRQARRESDMLTEIGLPKLWILTTSASDSLLASFGFKLERETWGEGIYELAEAMKTALVVINRLPQIPETLWLRILGKGATQQRAIDEIFALPQTDPLRDNILELIATWQVNIQLRDDLTEDDQELLMNLTPAYLQWREETLQRGRQEGLQMGLQQGVQQGIQQGRVEGQRIFVENLLIARFGAIDEALSRIIPFLLELPAAELSRVLLQLSREELLARFDRQGN